MLDNSAGHCVNYGVRIEGLVWPFLAPSRDHGVLPGPANAPSAHFTSETNPALKIASLYIVPLRMKITRASAQRVSSFGPQVSGASAPGSFFLEDPCLAPPCATATTAPGAFLGCPPWRATFGLPSRWLHARLRATNANSMLRVPTQGPPPPSKGTTQQTTPRTLLSKRSAGTNKTVRAAAMRISLALGSNMEAADPVFFTVPDGLAANL